MTLTVHVYQPGPYPDHRGDPFCTCGSAKGDSVHQVRPQSEEQTEYEQRILGERDE